MVKQSFNNLCGLTLKNWIKMNNKKYSKDKSLREMFIKVKNTFIKTKSLDVLIFMLVVFLGF